MIRFILIGLTVAGVWSKARLPFDGFLDTGSQRSFASEHRRPATLAPGQVTDLIALPLSDSAVVLTWTEVSSGTTSIARYVVRYDSLGKFLWHEEVDVLMGGCRAPIVGSRASGGRPHACVLSGLSPNVAYEFQMVAYTGTLNVDAVFGPLSNISETTTAERVGSMLVWRSRMFLDSLTIASVSVTEYGDTRFPLQGTFLYGDRTVAFFDSVGNIVGRGYLLVTRP